LQSDEINITSVTNAVNAVEEGDDVQVNAVDVGAIVNLNDDTPAAPTGHLNVKWQKSATSGGHDASAYIPAPVPPNGIGAGGMIGHIMNAKMSDTARTPFGSTTAATPVSQTEQWICPASGWITSPSIRNGSEAGNGVARRLGIQRNGTNFWDSKIEPQAAAGIASVDGNTFARVIRGDQVMSIAHSTGNSDQNSFGLWSAEFVGDNGEQILGGVLVGSAGGTIYNPVFGHGNTATEANARTPFKVAGVMKWLYLKLNTTLTGNAGESATFTVFKNGVATSLAVTVPVDGPGTFDGGLDDTVWNNIADEITFASGDTVSFETTVSHASVGALEAQVSFAYLPATSTKKMLVGHFQDNQVAAAQYPPPFLRGNAAAQATEANSYFVATRPFTVPADGLQVYVYTAMTLDNVHTWTVRKNGVDTGVVLTINAASGTGVLTSSGTEVDFDKGDLFSIESIGVSGTNGGASGAIAGWSLEYTE
jgi:hypothetical protein